MEAENFTGIWNIRNIWFVNGKTISSTSFQVQRKTPPDTPRSLWLKRVRGAWQYSWAGASRKHGVWALPAHCQCGAGCSENEWGTRRPPLWLLHSNCSPREAISVWGPGCSWSSSWVELVITFLLVTKPLNHHPIVTKAVFQYKIHLECWDGTHSVCLCLHTAPQSLHLWSPGVHSEKHLL